MRDLITRRTFQAALAVSAMAASTTPMALAADENRDYPAPRFRPPNKKPKLGTLLVQDFVIFAHYDLDMVKTLLSKEPALLNATFDWGAGDWETALGGA